MMSEERETDNEVARACWHLRSVWCDKCNRAADLIEQLVARQSATDAVSAKGVTRGYQWKELFLPDGTDVGMQYKGQSYYAKVEGDQLIYGGVATTPASLVNTITSSNRNAWHDLWVKRPSDPVWRLADDCRRLAMAPQPARTSEAGARDDRTLKLAKESFDENLAYADWLAGFKGTPSWHDVWMARSALARASEAAAGGAVAFRWRRRSRDKWEYETHATLSDADTVRVMLEDGWEAEWLGVIAAPQPASEQQEVRCSLGCKSECKADLHGCSSECPSPSKRRAILAAAKGDDHE